MPIFSASTGSAQSSTKRARQILRAHSNWDLDETELAALDKERSRHAVAAGKPSSVTTRIDPVWFSLPTSHSANPATTATTAPPQTAEKAAASILKSVRPLRLKKTTSVTFSESIRDDNSEALDTLASVSALVVDSTPQRPIASSRRSLSDEAAELWKSKGARPAVLKDTSNQQPGSGSTLSSNSTGSKGNRKSGGMSSHRGFSDGSSVENSIHRAGTPRARNQVGLPPIALARGLSVDGMSLPSLGESYGTVSRHPMKRPSLTRKVSFGKSVGIGGTGGTIPERGHETGQKRNRGSLSIDVPRHLKRQRSVDITGRRPSPISARQFSVDSGRFSLTQDLDFGGSNHSSRAPSALRMSDRQFSIESYGSLRPPAVIRASDRQLSVDSFVSMKSFDSATHPPTPNSHKPSSSLAGHPSPGGTPVGAGRSATTGRDVSRKSRSIDEVHRQLDGFMDSPHTRAPVGFPFQSESVFQDSESDVKRPGNAVQQPELSPEEATKDIADKPSRKKKKPSLQPAQARPGKRQHSVPVSHLGQAGGHYRPAPHSLQHGARMHSEPMARVVPSAAGFMGESQMAGPPMMPDVRLQEWLSGTNRKSPENVVVGEEPGMVPMSLHHQQQQQQLQQQQQQQSSAHLSRPLLEPLRSFGSINPPGMYGPGVGYPGAEHMLHPSAAAGHPAGPFGPMYSGYGGFGGEMMMPHGQPYPFHHPSMMAAPAMMHGYGSRDEAAGAMAAAQHANSPEMTVPKERQNVEKLTRTKSKVTFGHPKSGALSEGQQCTRRMLLISGVHKSDMLPVNFSDKDGCDSILITDTKDAPSTKKELEEMSQCLPLKGGGSAMFKNFKKHLPVRILRAVKTESSKGTFYRYDGLYTPYGILNEAGKNCSRIPQGAKSVTYLLKRNPVSARTKTSNSLKTASLLEIIGRGSTQSPHHDHPHAGLELPTLSHSMPGVPMKPYVDHQQAAHQHAAMMHPTSPVPSSSSSPAGGMEQHIPYHHAHHPQRHTQFFQVPGDMPPSSGMMGHRAGMSYPSSSPTHGYPSHGHPHGHAESSKSSSRPSSRSLLRRKTSAEVSLLRIRYFEDPNRNRIKSPSSPAGAETIHGGMVGSALRPSSIYPGMRVAPNSAAGGPPMRRTAAAMGPPFGNGASVSSAGGPMPHPHYHHRPTHGHGHAEESQEEEQEEEQEQSSRHHHQQHHSGPYGNHDKSI